MIYFLLFFQQFLASTTHIIGQDAAQHIDPDIILLFRATIAGATLLMLVVGRDKSHRVLAGIAKPDLWRVLLLGFLNVPLNQWLFLHGLKHTTAANSALLYAMTPAIVFLLTKVFHRETHSWLKICGVALAFVGVSMIIFERGLTISSEYTQGNLMIFGAVIAWSLYTIVGKPLVERYGALRMTALNMCIGALLYLPFGAAELADTGVANITSTGWGEILYLAIMASVVNYLLWFYALGKLPTSRVAIFQNLQPVMTTVLALMLGKAVITHLLVSGGILTIIGVILVQFG